MKIRLKRGTRIRSDAQTIYSELEAVREECGGTIDLQRVVDRAKPKTASLHDEFTWSNAEAGKKWRLHEARKLVQSIEVIHTNGKPTRAYESIEVVEVDIEVRAGFHLVAQRLIEGDHDRFQLGQFTPFPF